MAVTAMEALVGNPATGNLRLSTRMMNAYCVSWGAQGLVMVVMSAAQSLWMLLAACSGLAAPLAGVSLSTFLADRSMKPNARRFS
ncbi:hypothetical protein [Streptomyces lasalocidi]|uniref:Uncharacterized protein n=1 Tax=Streptomyces lasalocidi TaxID=324833 RepID=A0A4U5W7M2_STRLS|nr:hypothetical protein [Streptomyces lasalocidi]TKS96135.1 hypothetical protein E4U91_35800 [Streptomyces lasalocidi]